MFTLTFVVNAVVEALSSRAVHAPVKRLDWERAGRRGLCSKLQNRLLCSREKQKALIIIND